MQDLKSQSCVKLSKLIAQQISKSFFEIRNKLSDINFFLAIFQRFQHNSTVLRSDVINCLPEINRLVSIFSPKF